MFCIGALLVRVNNEKSVVDWVKDIRRDIAAIQGPVLHFRDLSPTKRLRACTMVADLPARAFVVCSNKKNMRGYNNERAAERGGKQWYYNFCVRLLMERVTELCQFAIAKTIASFAIDLTISTVTTPGALTPRKTSAPTIASARVPV